MRLLVSTVLLTLLASPAFAQQAEDYYDPAVMVAARENLRQMHGDTVNSLFIAERLETRMHDGDSELVWEAQGWVGKDRNKLWLKTEGETESDEAELQALWSHAISPFWDFQAGIRHDFNSGAARGYAVIGLMGLAPYWFEVDAVAFVSHEGDASARLEVEYEMRFTQRLILQPRLEIDYPFNDERVAGTEPRVNKAELGLRLRYEFRREIAPYLGVSWEKSFGSSADLLEAAGRDTDQAAFVLGLRVWY